MLTEACTGYGIRALTAVEDEDDFVFDVNDSFKVGHVVNRSDSPTREDVRIKGAQRKESRSSAQSCPTHYVHDVYLRATFCPWSTSP